ncbi:MAG: CatB-related O-acetyltransferase [Candidatus Absconditabacterales bacterium]
MKLGYIFKAIRYVLSKLFKPIAFIFFVLKYRIKNHHNHTIPKYPASSIDFFSLKNVKIGRYTYGVIDVEMRGHPGESLSIGDYCSIAHDVTFILGGNHKYKNLLTYPLGIMNKIPGVESREYYSNGGIEVGDDVWIGTGAKVMSGITIGQGAIIAAYSVVTKSVPPYAIVGGVPAKLIKHRFSDEIIEKLIKINYKKIPITKLLDIYDEIAKEDFDIDKVCNVLYTK